MHDGTNDIIALEADEAFMARLSTPRGSNSVAQSETRRCGSTMPPRTLCLLPLTEVRRYPRPTAQSKPCRSRSRVGLNRCYCLMKIGRREDGRNL